MVAAELIVVVVVVVVVAVVVVVVRVAVTARWAGDMTLHFKSAENGGLIWRVETRSIAKAGGASVCRALV
ncbi:hypothetical protein E2C01_039715 [Portunus trituberculatus]|uniref:Uncharacterized protein n=1 Tax=Portunus trituberculatus TaxID=210409 RepID=A0A5B7FM06_PORTR|nr:hypothetical protein [Portunus trituberculatus]